MINQNIIGEAKNHIHLSKDITKTHTHVNSILNMELITNICDELNNMDRRLKYLTNNINCLVLHENIEEKDNALDFIKSKGLTTQFIKFVEEK